MGAGLMRRRLVLLGGGAVVVAGLGGAWASGAFDSTPTPEHRSEGQARVQEVAWEEAVATAFTADHRLGHPDRYARYYCPGTVFLQMTGVDQGRLVEDSSAAQRRGYRAWLSDAEVRTAALPIFQEQQGGVANGGGIPARPPAVPASPPPTAPVPAE